MIISYKNFLSKLKTYETLKKLFSFQTVEKKVINLQICI